MGIYAERREKLHRRLRERGEAGRVLFAGHVLQPRNYGANVYRPFRQNSHVAYYFGIHHPGFVGVLEADGRSLLFGPQPTLEDVVWEGPLDGLEVWGQRAEVEEAHPIEDLEKWIRDASDGWLYTRPYQADLGMRMARWFGCTTEAVMAGASKSLSEEIVSQRLVKSAQEVAEIERALAMTAAGYEEVMRALRPGVTTASLMGRVMRRAYEEGVDVAYPPIITSHGEILHAHGDSEVLQDGRLLLMDMGFEAPSLYASDITRTMPINGRFTPMQRDIYEVVLQAQSAAIAAIRPGISYRDVHDIACEAVASGLVEVGLMKGDVKEAVAVGAHALFFPHGLGHALGLDVHDMEDLGDQVGYGGEGLRSAQFGRNFLRFARTLEEGYVVTVEPGIYFIPALIGQWKAEGRHADFLAYDRLEAWLAFGGIRIEDDVWVTAQGSEVLGPVIPKQIEDIEAMVGTAA